MYNIPYTISKTQFMLDHEINARTYDQNNSPIIILASPSPKLSWQMSSLRNQLSKRNLNYEQESDFQVIQQKIGNQKNNVILIINNNDIKDSEIPSSLKSKEPSLQIYCYPQESKKFVALRTTQQILKKINNSSSWRQYHNSNGNRHHIKMKSLKKLFKASSSHQMNYDNILIHKGSNPSPSFQELANILLNQQFCSQIKSQTHLGRYKGKKSLLITQINSANTFNKFIVEVRLKKDIDMVILGLKKDKILHNQNIVLVTDSPQQILQFISDSGKDLAVTKFENNYSTQKAMNQYDEPPINNHYDQYNDEYNQQRQSPYQNNQGEYQSHHSVKAQNSNKKINEQDRIINDIPYSAVMMTKRSEEQDIDKYRIESEPVHQINTIDSAKKPKKIKKINQKSTISNTTNNDIPNKFPQDVSALKKPHAQFILDKQNVYHTQLAESKPIMNWDVFIPKGESEYIIHPARENPSISSVKPKSQNISSELQQESQTSIKQSENRNSNLNYGVIPEVSDQYRGSNRESYIGDQQSRTLKNGVSDRNTLNDLQGANNMVLQEERAPTINIINSNRSMTYNTTTKLSDRNIQNQTNSAVAINNNNNNNNKMRQEYERAKYQLKKNNINNEIIKEHEKPNDPIIINKTKYDGPSNYYQNPSYKQTSQSARNSEQNNIPKYQYDRNDEIHRKNDSGYKNINQNNKIVLEKNQSVKPAEYVSSMKYVSDNRITTQNNNNNQNKYISTPTYDYTNNARYIDNKYVKQSSTRTDYSPIRVNQQTTNSIKNNNYISNTSYKSPNHSPNNSITYNNIHKNNSTSNNVLNGNINNNNRSPNNSISNNSISNNSNNKTRNYISPNSSSNVDYSYTNIYNNKTNITSPTNYQNSINSHNSLSPNIKSQQKSISYYNKQQTIDRNRPSSPTYSRYGSTNLQKSVDKISNDISKSRIIDAKSIDLDKYQKRVDENGRVTYISKTNTPISSTIENSKINTRYINSANNTINQTSNTKLYTTQSKSPTNNNYRIVNNDNKNYIKQQETHKSYNRPSIANNIPKQYQQNKYTTANTIVQSRNYDNNIYKHQKYQKNYVSPNKDHYKQVKIQKISHNTPSQTRQGLRVYTRQQYDKISGSANATNVRQTRQIYESVSAKNMSGQKIIANQKVSQQRFSQNYIKNQQKPQIYPSSNTINSGYTADIIKQGQNKTARYNSPQNNYNSRFINESNATSSSQDKFRQSQVTRKQYKPFQYQSNESKQITKNTNYKTQTQKSILINSNKRLSESRQKTQNFSSTKQKINEPNRNTLNYIPMGHESRSSSNSSGIVAKHPRLITNHNLSEFDKRVIEQNSHIQENKEVSDPPHKIILNQQPFKEGLQTLYLHVNHKNIKNRIDGDFPNKYNIRLFRDLDQLNYDRDAIVMLHPDTDTLGHNLPVRQFQSVYMLGNTSKVPSGTIRIQENDLQYVL